MDNKKLQIHNSTVEFLIFQLENKEDGVEVLYQDETLWLTQDAIATLFDKGRSTIAEHLRNIFHSQELQEEAVCRKFRRTAADGKDYFTKYYNLDAVIFRLSRVWIPVRLNCAVNKVVRQRTICD